MLDRKVENMKRLYHGNIVTTSKCPVCGQKSVVSGDKYCRKCVRTGRVETFLAEQEAEARRREIRRLHAQGRYGLSTVVSGGKGKTDRKREARQTAKQATLKQADAEVLSKIESEETKKPTAANEALKLASLIAALVQDLGEERFAERRGRVDELLDTFGPQELVELSVDEIEELIAA